MASSERDEWSRRRATQVLSAWVGRERERWGERKAGRGKGEVTQARADGGRTYRALAGCHSPAFERRRSVGGGLATCMARGGRLRGDGSKGGRGNRDFGEVESVLALTEVTPGRRE